MSDGARNIALLMRETAREMARHQIQGITIGTVRKAYPDLRIQPLTGAIAIPDDQLRWTTHSRLTRENLLVDDQVLLARSQNIYYVLGEVSFDNEIVAGGAGGGGDVTQAEFDGHVNQTTTAHGGIVANTDPRLTNSRSPSGPAGGVLSGNYPNPGFAQSMATGADLVPITNAVVAAQNNIDTHEALTTTAHGGIVSSSDARLTDARAPTAHAATHKSGGSDQIRLNEFQVPNAAVPMNGQIHTGLGAGSAAGHSLRWEQLFKTSELALLGGLKVANDINIQNFTIHGSGGGGTMALNAIGLFFETSTGRSILDPISLKFGPEGYDDWGMSRIDSGIMQMGTGNWFRSQEDAIEGEDLVRFSQVQGVYAPLDSPDFTGNPTAPTKPLVTDNDSIATMANIHDAMDAVQIGYTVYAILPVGSEMSWPGTGTIPSGWFEANGGELLIATYPDLYNRLTANGTQFPFGANTNGSGGAGSTHFRLPNRKSRVLVGMDAGDTNFDAVGETGGANSVTLATNQLPQHTHAGTVDGAGGHSHTGRLQDHSHGGAGFSWSGTTDVANNNVGFFTSVASGASRPTVSHGHQYSGSGTTGNTGNVAAFTGGFHGAGSIVVDGAGDHSHTFTGGNINGWSAQAATSLLQKYAVTRWIIKAVVVEDTPEWGDNSCALRTLAIQSIADSTASKVIVTAWSELSDTGNAWDAAAPSRLTASEIGNYSVQGGIRFTANGTGARAVGWYKNGVYQDTIAQIPAAPVAVQTIVPFSLSTKLVPGDYIEIGVYQTSGISLNVEIGSNVSFVREGFATGAGSQSQEIETTMTPTLVPVAGTTYAPDFTYTVIRVDTASTPKTINIPTAVGNKGKKLIIKDAVGLAATNNITVDASGSETIDGAPTLVMDSERQAVTIVSDGAGWITETASASAGGGGRNDFAFFMGLI